MQLQRSLFSFYKVFIRKTPVVIWIGLSLVLLLIVSSEILSVYQQQSVYNFDECLMQYYNATRGGKQQKKQSQKSQTDQVKNDTAQLKVKQQIPYYLKPSYYHVLNETSSIRVYLSDQISYNPGQPSCRIILNIQKIRINQQNQQDSKKNDTEKQNSQTAKVVKILQQFKEQITVINQSKSKQQIKVDQKQNYINLKEIPKQQIINQNSHKPQNVKNYDEIRIQEKKFFSNEHPYMHLTANSHIVYLDQTNEFQDKHGIQVHAIVISKQNLEFYPNSILGISSKFWRFHGNQQIERNGITLKTFSDSFQKVTQKVKQIYAKNVQIANTIIAIKKFNEDIKKNSINQTNQTNLNKSQLVTDDQRKKKEIIGQNTGDEKINQEKLSSNEIDELPSFFISMEEIYPLSQMKIYFHYPQTLRFQELNKLVNVVSRSSGIIFKIFLALFLLINLYMISALVGLLVRYVFFLITTIYLFFGGCFITKQWGWVSKYYNLIKNRNTQHQNFLFGSSGKMLVLFTLAMTGILGIFTIGSKYILENIFIYSMTFSENYYSEMFLKNFFLIEMFYFVCCRSRLSLRYFPLYSLNISVLILFLNTKFYCRNICWLANLHLWLHLILMCIFAAFENHIGNSKFYNQFTPSEEKPRALYYAGYDISWENTLPPIWTYFTTSFDLKYFDEREKCLINRDYQLLYGRLIGMNERQELPEDEQNSNQEEVDELNQNLNESNEMSLIR